MPLGEPEITTQAADRLELFVGATAGSNKPVHIEDLQSSGMNVPDAVVSQRHGKTPVAFINNGDQPAIRFLCNDHSVDRIRQIFNVDAQGDPVEVGGFMPTHEVFVHDRHASTHDRDLNFYAMVFSSAERQSEGQGIAQWQVTLLSQVATSGTHSGKTWNMGATLATAAGVTP